MNKYILFWVIIIMLIAPVIVTSSGGDMNKQSTTFQSLSEVPDSKWEELSQKNIYFGHQSVGYNILDGIKDIMKANPQIKLKVVESTDFKSQNDPTFFHSGVGKNTEPISKMKSFEKIMTGENAGKIDTAFLKFCYVDILSHTNSEEVFNEYNATLSRIKEINPKTQFIHFTVPLTTIQSGPKAWIKKILGRAPWGSEENVRRFEYNELLTSSYSSKEPIFDLAQVESKKPDGTRTTYNKGDKAYPALNPQYTTDGGHLNELGKKIMAENLLIFLANQIN